MKKLLYPLTVALLVVGALLLTNALVNNWYTLPDRLSQCKGINVTPDVAISEDLKKCFELQAQKYLMHDYQDFKDLAKVFLTLLSATLVASITFSEKVVDIARAPASSLSAMVTCWLLLMAAIIACVGGLAFTAHAAWIAKYWPHLNFYQTVVSGVSMLLFSAGAFIVALFALITASVVSIVHKRTSLSSVSDSMPAAAK